MKMVNHVSKIEVLGFFQLKKIRIQGKMLIKWENKLKVIGSN